MRLRRPRGFPDHPKPACAYWKVPDDIPLSHYRDRMRAWQRGRCALCGWRDDRMVTDHDHDSGLVRGILCAGCNAVEPHSVHPAIEAYRAGINPATILEHVETYRSALIR